MTLLEIIQKIIEEQEDMSWGVGHDGWMQVEKLATKLTIAVSRYQLINKPDYKKLKKEFVEWYKTYDDLTYRDSSLLNEFAEFLSRQEV